MTTENTEIKPSFWSKYTPKTEEELRELALGIHSGVIYTDRNIREQSMMSIVFMPIVFGAFAGWDEEDFSGLGLIYEHLDKQLGRSVNGCPCFSSLNMISKEDADKVWEKIAKIEEMMKSV